MSTASTELEIVTTQQGLEPEAANQLATVFSPLLARAKEWETKVAAVTDPDVARNSRLILKALRVECDKARKSLKEDSLRRGRAIDGMYNVIEWLIVPMEKKLEDVEKAAERAEAARRAQLRRDRELALSPYTTHTAYFDLDKMPDGDFAELMASCKYAHEARVAQAAKAEADRIAFEEKQAEQRRAREVADALERERLRVENDRLKVEADERLKIGAAERAKAARDLAAAEAKRTAEIKAATAERAKLAEQARVEREARQKAEAKLKAQRDHDAAKARAEAAAAKKAAMAPDVHKFRDMADMLCDLNMPSVTTEAGASLVAEIYEEINVLAESIRTRAAAL